MDFSIFRKALPSGFLALVASLVSVSSGAARADVPGEGLWGVQVSDLSVAPTEAGGDARLRARLENFSGADLQLVGVKAAIAGQTALVVKTLNGGVEPAPGFSLLEEEALDFGTGHIEILLEDLGQAITDGEWVEVEFVFDKGMLSATAHVH